MGGNNYFCYSYKLFHFLCAFGEKCKMTRIHDRTGYRFWVFPKSERLDEIIRLYNKVKHEIT